MRINENHFPDGSSQFFSKANLIRISIFFPFDVTSFPTGFTAALASEDYVTIETECHKDLCMALLIGFSD